MIRHDDKQPNSFRFEIVGEYQNGSAKRDNQRQHELSVWSRIGTVNLPISERQKVASGLLGSCVCNLPKFSIRHIQHVTIQYYARPIASYPVVPAFFTVSEKKLGRLGSRLPDLHMTREAWMD